MRAILLLSILTLGCASTSKNNLSPKDIEFISTYKHPSYGEIKGDDSRLNSDRDECRNEVYAEGVIVNGQLVKDQAKLNKIESDYLFTFVQDQLKTNRTMPAEEKVMADAVEHAKKAPPHIFEIRKRQRSFEYCFRVKKQYKLIKTESYNRKTGKLISTTQH